MADERPTLGALHREVRDRMSARGLPDAAIEARLIVEEATGASRTDLVIAADRAVDRDAAARALAMVVRRLAGEPIHRILGWREFHGLRLELSAGTLEPRDDTEALVELALGFVRAAVLREGACRILDLGTGTGAVALALLAEEPAATAVGCDISSDALETAARNADINATSDRFRAQKSDWFAGITGRFHVIVSNPPYITSDDIGRLAGEVRDHDPRAALDGGKDGLDAYRAIAAGCREALLPGGTVAVEIGIDQRHDVETTFRRHGMALVGMTRDLGGIERALAFQVA